MGKPNSRKNEVLKKLKKFAVNGGFRPPKEFGFKMHPCSMGVGVGGLPVFCPGILSCGQARWTTSSIGWHQPLAEIAALECYDQRRQDRVRRLFLLTQTDSSRDITMSSSSHDSETESSSNLLSEPGSGLVQAGPGKTAREAHRGPLMGLALLAAALAATVSWGLGEADLFQFRPPIENMSMMGHPTRGVSPRSREIAMLKRSSCLLGTLGALLGVGMGLVGGQSSRGPRQALIAAGVGLLAGGIAGAAPPWIVIPPYLRAEEYTSGELGRSLMMHWGLWTALGAAAGLALGIGKRTRLLWAILGGILGAVGGTLAYEVLGGMVFPMAETGRPFPETWATRLMAMLFVAVPSALGAVLVSTLPRKSPRKIG